jgi:hypothetical protein
VPADNRKPTSLLTSRVSFVRLRNVGTSKSQRKILCVAMRSVPEAVATGSPSRRTRPSRGLRTGSLPLQYSPHCSTSPATSFLSFPQLALPACQPIIQRLITFRNL